MQTFKHFIYRVALVTAGMSALLVAVVMIASVFAFAVRAIIPGSAGDAHGDEKNSIVEWAYGIGDVDRQSDAEIKAAQVNDEAINNWVARCTFSLLLQPEIKARVRVIFGSDDEFYGKIQEDPGSLDIILPAATDLRFLSNSILIRRGENAMAASNSYFALQAATLVAIALGLATTVLVSLSSTEFGKGDGLLARSIRILAIVLPALGTATAAVAAFYSPGQSYSRATQALASYRQVHDQITTDLGPLQCPTSSKAGAVNDLATKLAVWKKSLRDAQTVAQAGTLAAADAKRVAADPTRGQTQPGRPGGSTGDVHQK